MSFQAYLDNIEEKTGKSPNDFIAMAKEKGFDNPKTKAGDIVAWLKEDYGLGRGHAMAIVYVIKNGAEIGDKHVTSQLVAEQLPLGGEPAGHIIVTDYLDSSDGIFAALMILETAHITNNWDLESFVRYPQVLLNVPIKIKKDLKTEPMASIIQQTQKNVGDGRLVVRYSGTENVLRIMLEAPKEEAAQHLAQGLAQQLGKLLEA